VFPDLNLTGFKATAWFDFIKFRSLVHGAHFSRSLSSRVRNPTKPGPDGCYEATLHDPTRDDLHFLMTELEDPRLNAVEIYIDLSPKNPHASDHVLQLEQCFLALAARLRVDDRHPTGAGFKSALTDNTRTPLTGRLPLVGEEMVIGHHSTGVNFKLYLKRSDQKRDLPQAAWRVRMEITMMGDGLGLFGLRNVSSLKDFGYRRAFARLFQVVDAATVRQRSDWSEALRSEADAKLQRRWRRVGVHAIGPKHMPEDALEATRQAVKYREAPGKHQTLSPRHYRFHLHHEAHRLIADSLRRMDYAMKSERFPGTAAGGCGADSQH
jgi:hypothetical protein